ncbi:ABC-type dipeptide/oligopeptide/nickel transport system, ATPase component [Pseudobutyrivibrio sp. OR37]|uniref:ABC transporter ATP-binding protein n=1 Tax=Pseudobutyrivibrio sp. OR37 TaxID=1798186 RepID=UPI0008ED6D7D|nr:ABC transporter ATP-binding protein [Pseudobutyrivibrio sp. OR37]SFH66808.1 ABC-type dipeptide/oligopeptide/nickel transport system, ATPase component [Pseudobutyrivibrio sp. OR37]
MSVLSYENVDISYNGNTVVKDINLKLEEGEILGIVGESGSGKTTVIKAAMNLLGKGGLVTRGDIWFKGMDIPDLSEKQMRKINGPEIGMIFQNSGSAFCPIRTVGDQLYEAMCAHEKISKDDFRTKATELFEKIGFSDVQRILKSYPFELSGGMQQRVGVAAAMLLNPKVILADEPTSALDVSIQRLVIDEMLKVRELFGTSMIIVSHNIGVINAMADNLIVMKDGQIIEYGKKDEVLNSPREEYTKKLMSAVPKLKR